MVRDRDGEPTYEAETETEPKPEHEPKHEHEHWPARARECMTHQTPNTRPNPKREYTRDRECVQVSKT